MKYTTKLLFPFVAIFLLSCESSDNKISSSFKNVPRVIVEFKDPVNNVKASELIDSVSYIKLETTRESRFGKISEFKIYKNNILILDETTNSIYLFKDNGAFVSKINLNFDLNLEHNISSFEIDAKKEQLIIYDRYQAQFYYFSLEGQFIRKENIPFSFKSFCVLGDKRIFYSGFEPFVDIRKARYLIDHGISSSNLVSISKNKIVNSYPLHNNIKLKNSSIYSSSRDFFPIGDTATFFSYPYSKEIYKLDGNGKIDTCYDFIMPKNTFFPDDFLTNAEYNDHWIDFSNKNNNRKLIWNISDIFRINNNRIVFNAQSFLYMNNLYIYDFNTKKVLDLNSLICDRSTDFLPLTNENFFASDKNILYGAIPAIIFFQHAKNTFLREQFLKNRELSDFLSTANNLSNPIIQRIYFK